MVAVEVIVVACSKDGWGGVSADLIDRFIDVMCAQQAFSCDAGRGCRAELVALDRWMQRRHGRTLASACSAELREYLGQRFEGEPHGGLLEPLRQCLRRFYRHLRDSGCRRDLVRIGSLREGR